MVFPIFSEIRKGWGGGVTVIDEERLYEEMREVFVISEKVVPHI